MKKIDDLINRLESFESSITGVVENVFKKHASEIIDQIQNQLLSGEGGDSKDLSPNYYEDPYFQSREQSEAYIKWKLAISPSSNRPPEVPNLFINGYFHDSLTLQVTRESTEVTSSVSLGKNDIIPKYGKDSFGMQDYYINTVVRQWVLKALQKEFKQTI